MKTKKIITFMIALLMLLGTFSGCTSNKDEIPLDEAKVTAEKYLADFTAGNYKKMVEDYEVTKEMASQITEAVLKAGWEGSVLPTCGAYVSTAYLNSTENGDNYFFYFDVSCEKAVAQIMVGVDKEGNISGLNIYGIKQLSAYDFSGVNVQEVTFAASDGLSVVGTLLLPENATQATPAAVIVPGSGPNDRYGTVNGVNHPYADLAKALCEKGIAVLVFDKRTFTYAGDASMAEAFNNITVEYEVVYDALGAYSYLKTLDNIDKDKIFIIGHSLGGYCLPMINKALAGNLPAGFVFLSAPSSNMEDLMLYQIKYLCEADGETSSEEADTIEECEQSHARVKGLTEDNKADYSSAELLNAPASYWLSVKDYDPVSDAAEITVPMLFLNGTADYQVPITEFEVYKQALESNPNAEFKALDNLNHLLMVSDGTRTPGEYLIAGNVSEKAITEISSFILSDGTE